MDPADYKDIHIDVRDNGVVVATMNRPDDLNPPVGRMHTELSHLAPDFDCDPAARVLVITGAGRAFAAGRRGTVMEVRAKLLGLDYVSDTPTDVGLDVSRDSWYEGRRLVDGILECRKPIISAVNGYALGLGSNIALLCDIVVAAKSAVFADTHVLTGVSAGDGGQLIWPMLMGVNRAKYYLMTGDRLTADEAERLGLVNFVVEDDELMGRALQIADRLAQGPQRAISHSKVAINQWMRAQSAYILPFSQALQENVSHGSDVVEGLMAFGDGREPDYSKK